MEFDLCAPEVLLETVQLGHAGNGGDPWLLRHKPAGAIRMAASEHAVHTVLWPVISPLVRSDPDLHVELVIDAGLNDIAAERFDAGVRLGEAIAKDMVAAPIGPDLRRAVVGSP